MFSVTGVSKQHHVHMASMSLFGCTDKYSHLFSGEAEQQVVAFLQGEHSLEEYRKEIEHFRDLAKEISGHDDIVHFDMFTLECHDIKRGLSLLAQLFADKLLGQLAGKHRAENERLVLACLAKGKHCT